MRRQSPLFQLLLYCLLGSVCACATSGGPPPTAMSTAYYGGALRAPDSAAVAAGAEHPSDYRVGAQDLLEISVFQVNDLNRTVRVNTSGEISLPLIGIVPVGGRTVQEVESDIAGKLTQRYLQNPQVSVFVKEFTSQRVTVEGALRRPGIYPLTGQTTLLQAIAMAEGLNEKTNPEGVLVFRRIDGQKKAAAFDLRQIRRGMAEDPVIYGDDIVVVEESGRKSAFSRLIKSMPLMGVFTLF